MQTLSSNFLDSFTKFSNFLKEHLQQSRASRLFFPGFLLILLSLAFLSVNSSEAQKKNLVKKTALRKMVHWQAYNLTEEGSYVLRLNNQSAQPIENLLQNIDVYIPATSFVKEHERNSKQIFIPSSGEYLVQVNLLKLLREEGLNVSLRSHSFVYLVSQKPTKNLELEVYKIGPAKPLLSQAY